MSLFVLTNQDLYMALAERGEGIVGRVISILGSDVTSGRQWFHFKIAVKKYARTKGVNCKQDYYIVKVWGDNVEQCKPLIKKGCKIKFAGEFIKDTAKDDIGTHHCGVIHLIKLINVEAEQKLKEGAE